MKEIEILKRMNACGSAIDWLETQKSYKQAWQDCKRGNWMLWLIRKTTDIANEQELRRLTLAKARCVMLVLHLMQDERSKHAVKVAEAFGLGEATKKELDAAADAADTAAATADAAYAAAAADTAAAAYAAAAADTAAAAYVAAAAAADTAAAAYAADAAYAAAAADTAAAAYAADDAREKMLAKCADIVRELYPDPPAL